MISNTLRWQTLLVLTLVVMAGWPRYEAAPRLSIWRSGSPAAPKRELIATPQGQRTLDAEPARTRRSRAVTRVEETTEEESLSAVQRATELQRTRLDDAPMTIEESGARLNLISGRARTVTGDPVRYARLVLRNTSTGLVQARTTADQEGRFAFLDVIPSGYVVELVGMDGSVIASSELVAVNNGDARQTTIRVAANSTVRAIFGSALGNTTGSTPGGLIMGASAAETIAQAAAAGGSAMTTPGNEQSPRF